MLIHAAGRCALLILVALASFTQNAHAQYDFSKVDDWLADNVSKMGGRTILLVYKDGKIIHTEAVNEMSRRQKMVGKFIAKRQGKTANTDDFTPTTRQLIASCSKWYSAALVMTFVDEGRLKLEDTVGKWLPALARSGKGHITISQCLSHMTAIKAPDLKESLQEMRKFNSMDEVIEKIASYPMEGQPGKVFRYSNTGLQIAGAVIEKISGKNFETLFAERIARPLDMKNSDFGKGKVALPAGGASSTPNDYMNFLIMLLNKGVFNGKRILSEKSVADMQVNRVTNDVKVAYAPAEAGNFGYGFGGWVMRSHAAGATQGPVTSPGLFGSYPWIDNQQGYCAFLMCFYLKNDGRHERYVQLKKLVDEAVR
ncbi:beta-lactamase family protein [Pseudoflavitalea sp. X16]|nr:beta-lactamase family protein [Paraflavitalea devenefica]